jgi:hypothetical protein
MVSIIERFASQTKKEAQAGTRPELELRRMKT